MKEYIILAKRGIYIPVDMFDESSSEEIKSLTEQEFVIAFDSCRAESKEHALNVWQSQRNGTYAYDNVRTSTTHFISKSSEVYENMGVVTATIVAGTNIFRDLLAGISDVTGGNSGVYMSKFEQIKSQSLLELRKKADKLDCNAVVGVSIDVSEVTGGGKSMLMVTATGTAVTVIESL